MNDVALFTKLNHCFSYTLQRHLLSFIEGSSSSSSSSSSKNNGIPLLLNLSSQSQLSGEFRPSRRMMQCVWIVVHARLNHLMQFVFV
jgi:hypothetical protein